MQEVYPKFPPIILQQNLHTYYSKIMLAYFVNA